MSDHRNNVRPIREKPRGRKVCAFCGSADATTRDHVPPQNIFFEPRPSDLITVPACPRCNTGTSDDDEKFRVMLSLDVGADTPELRKWWSGPVLRGIRRNKKTHRELRENMRRVKVVTPSGLYLGERTELKINAAAYKRTVVKITRGLYFHHYGDVLPLDTPVVPTHYKQMAPGMAEIFNQLTKAAVGGKQFQYAYGRASDDPRASMWFYLFHEKHLVSASTGLPVGSE